MWGYDARNLKIIDGVHYYIKDGSAMVTGHNANVTNVTILSTIENNGYTYSVTNIGYGAFDGCTSLASIEIPSSVTSIGEYTFYGCTSLAIYCEAESEPSGWGTNWNYSNRPVVWGYDARNLKIIDGVHYYIKDGSAMVTGRNANVTNVTILSSIENNGDTYSVTSIAKYAFSYCTSLTSIEIPSSVTSIDSHTFSGCTSLTSIEIPSSLTSIGEYAFDGCRSLTSIVIPSSVTSIGEYAFSGCTSLTSIEIPSSVTSIGGRAFAHCTSLASIEIPSSVTSIGEYAFAACTSLTIYCEAESWPSGWSSSWNYSDRPVVWGYSENA